jgi:hypothetical protein
MLLKAVEEPEDTKVESKHIFQLSTETLLSYTDN